MRLASLATIPGLLLLAGSAFAQAPAPPAEPETVAGNVSVGLALTSGNKDTSTFNASYEVAYDPKTANVVKSSGLFLRGTTDGESTAEQLALLGRDEYSFTKRAFVFGELRYLHDKFKAISYLLAPTAGVGVRLVDSPNTLLSAAAGVGGVWEKNPERDVDASGAVTAEQRLSHKLSATATITAAVTALWKMEQFSDALYTFGAGMAVSIVSKAQLKVEVLDTYKNKPPTAEVEKNDVSLVMGIVYKF